MQTIKLLNEHRITIAQQMARLRVKRTGLTAGEEWLYDNDLIIQRSIKSLEQLFHGADKRLLHRDTLAPFLDNYINQAEFQYRGGDFAVAMELAARETQCTVAELWLAPRSLELHLIGAIAAQCRDTQDGRRMGRLIGALQRVQSLDWSRFFFQICPQDQILCADATYAAMEEESKSDYLRRVGRIAKRCKTTECAVCKAAMELCVRQEGVRAHVGYYLMRAGRAELFRALGCRPPHQVSPVYYAGIVYGGALVLSAVTAWVTGHIWPGIAIFLPATQVVSDVFIYLASRITLPNAAARIRVGNALPKPTLCAYVTLLCTRADAARAEEALSAMAAANRVSNLRFAWVVDLPESDAPKTAKDDALIRAAEEAIARLNHEKSGRFFLFLRRRVKSGRVFMGWERKRGALLELCRHLRGQETTFLRATKLEGVEYVITLDADTKMEIGTAARLVGCFVHPLNAHYTFLAPNIAPLPTDASANLFTKLFAGSRGIDCYQSATPNFYRDLFDDGIFTGKGIFHVDRYLAALDGTIPENRVLSHDLLEGALGGCSTVTDTTLYDGFPQNYLSYQKRSERWQRGDWQLLPYLMRRVRRADGTQVPNPLRFLSRYQILDNLRRHSVVVAEFCLIYMAIWLDQPLYLLVPVIVALAARQPFARWMADYLFLPTSLWTALQAAIVSWWRMARGKNLLTWRTAAQCEADGTTLGSYLKFMKGSWMFGALYALSAVWRGGSYEAMFLVLGVIWTVAPLYAFSMGQTVQTTETKETADNAYLQDIAARTWNYFATYVTAEESFLPPDNVQLEPFRGAAHRTGPTNIGLYLLSALAAYDLQLIDQQSLFSRISDTLTTIERMEHWNGHLLNWYDTQTAAPLYPRYVSTVDSGNLLGCYIALLEGLRPMHGAAKLCARIQAQIDAMQFRPLFDERDQLFAVGYDLEEGRLTSSRYDLLMSEARQAVFLAVARGDVPPKAWFRLSRTFVRAYGEACPVSWTGTIFEYLMPELLMNTLEGGLIDYACHAAVRAQIAYTMEQYGVWGTSESGYASMDVEGNYRYHAFGVPALGLKMVREESGIIAPYASCMALMTARRVAEENLHALEAYGMLGECGFYEAIDFVSQDETSIVKSFMAHHQGMSLIALTNVLCDNVMQKRFHQNAAVRGAELLLCEGVPRRANVTAIPAQQAKRRVMADAPPTVRQIEGEFAVHALHAKPYSVFLDSRGHSLYRRGTLCCSRFRPLYDEDCGEFYYAGGVRLFVTDALFMENTAVFHYGDTLERTVTLTEDGVMITRLVAKQPICAMTELTLDQYEAEQAHSAFSKLFVETSFAEGVIAAHRRPRAESDCGVFAAMRVIGAAAELESSRAAFVGESGTLDAPQALKRWIGEEGVVLDPCFAFRAASDAPFYTVCVMVDSREEVSERLSRYTGVEECEAAFQSDRRVKTNLTSLEELFAWDAMARLAYRDISDAAHNAAKRACKETRTALWRLGISGDLPILVLHLTQEDQLDVAERLCRCRDFWKRRGQRCDVVFLCDDCSRYIRPMMDTLRTMLCDGTWADALDQNGGIFLKDGSALSGEDRALLAASATLWIEAETPNLPQEILPEKPRIVRAQTVRQTLGEVEFQNGYGGFLPDGTYRIVTDETRATPAPWCNVVANETFGFLVDERGRGYTWADNSRESKLTPWGNDAVRRTNGEQLRVEQDGEMWELLGGSVLCEHGLGFSRFIAENNGIRAEVTMTVDRSACIKMIRVRLDADRDAAYAVSLAITPVLGVSRSDTVTNLVVEDGTARLGDKCLFIGAEGAELSGCTARVPCSGAQTVIFTLAYGKPASVSEAQFERALHLVAHDWDDLCNTLQIETPSDALNILVNRRLLYQTVACRLWARTSFYQCGGAFGFRDQLQDVLSLLIAAPQIARRQILLHAAHQFREGDAVHWWHREEGKPDRGVRTQISDDRLWLCYVTAAYLRTSGDRTILEESVPYLGGEVLGEGEDERYTTLETEGEGTLYEHCVAAIDITARLGAHGLPLMGSGDWNDGMNSVGEEGRGESVWLCFFLIRTVQDFLPYCKAHDRDRFSAMIATLKKNVEQAWDGAWYRRAYFDDQTPLGSHENEDGKIDAISQSWSVMALGDTPRTRQAMESLDRRLLDRDLRVVRLLDPPFASGKEQPGYIRGYAAGLRENGGQYTHGALWAAVAAALLGDGNRAMEYLEIMNPILHSLTQHSAAAYAVEPYVIAADVYTARGQEGRGGWSWYTGAAAWYYRAAVTYLLGFRKEGDRVRITPHVPDAWSEFRLIYRYKTATYRFHCCRGEKKTEEITLLDDGKVHEMTIFF